MCNLYSITKGPSAIRQFARAMLDRTGNLPPLPGVFPDYEAPVVRNAEGGRELLKMRWGMPGPKQFGEQPVTNIRNVASSHWRAWLKPEFRCVVPASSFCEYEDTKPKKTPTWFALDEDRPLFAFAGIWRSWHGVRGTKAENPDRVAADHLVFSFLTTDANVDVAPIHPKAMPVILTTPEEVDACMGAPAADVPRLQRPLPDGTLRIVARASGRTANGYYRDQGCFISSSDLPTGLSHS